MTSLKIMTISVFLVLAGMSLILMSKITTKVKTHAFRMSMLLFTISIILLIGLIGYTITKSSYLMMTSPYGPVLYGITLLVMLILIWIFSFTGKEWARTANRIICFIFGTILIMSNKIFFDGDTKMVSMITMTLITMTFTASELCLDSKEKNMTDEKLGDIITRYGYVLSLIGCVMIYTCKTCGEQGLGDVKSAIQGKLKSATKSLNKENISQEAVKLKTAAEVGFNFYQT